MTFRLPVLVLLCAASVMPWHIPGAVSPLSAEDYVFVKPGQTNLITGLVVGDTGDYGALRYEDIAFLSEAFAERKALGSASYSTNEFERVLGNTNVIYTGRANTNKNWNTTISATQFDSSVLDSYLSDTCTLSDTPRVRKDVNQRYDTNVTVICEEWLWKTNKYSIPLTPRITQVMTNGMLNVYTNFTLATTNSFVSNILYKVSVTNRLDLTPMDLCTEKIVETMDKSKLWRQLTKTTNSIIRIPTLIGPYSKATMTNHYALVRAMRRVVPRSVGVIISSTNATETTWGSINGGSSDHLTTNVLSLSYSVVASKTSNEKDIQRKIDDEWQSDPGYPSTRTVITHESTIPDSFPLLLTTGICSNIIEYLSEEGRVKSAKSYALVSMDRRITRSSYHTISDGYQDDVSTNLTANGSVIIPCGSTSRQQGHTNLTFTLTAPANLYSQASGLIGLTYRDASFSPDLPPVGSPEYYTQYEDTYRVKEKHQYASETLFGSIDFYLVIETNPNTKLSSWSEYE